MQRMTKQRQAVLDELTRVTDFRSAQQIFEDLHVQGQRVGLATVYRMVGTLEDIGVLTRSYHYCLPAKERQDECASA